MNGLLSSRRAPLLGAAALLTGHQIGELGVPVVLGFAIDDALTHSGVSRLLVWLLVLAVDFLTLSLCWRFGSRAAAALRFTIAHDLRSRVVACALGAPVRESGELLTLAVSDARRVGDAVRMGLSGVAGAAVLVVALVAVAVISPLLAVVVVAGAIVTLIAVALLSRPVEARSHTEQEANADAAAMAVDLVAGLRVIAGLQIAGHAADRYRAVSATAVDGAVGSAQAQSVVAGIAAFAVGCYLAAVAGVSGELALHGQISIGAVIAVLGLSQLLITPLQAIAQAVPSVRRGRASAARIAALLDGDRDALAASAASAASASPAGAAGHARAEIDVATGTLHGIVCDAPAQAEMLCRALGGEAPGGALSVAVDGAAIPQITDRPVLVWPPKGFPLGATVGELVGAGVHGPEVARRAVDAAAVTEVVDRASGGWEAPVSEFGGGLSGGERQRIALARALAAESDVLVLCEPTSAVDAVTEVAIAAGITRMREGRTTVLLTASPTLLAACQRVTFIIDGGIVACGPHSALLGDPRYRKVVAR